VSHVALLRGINVGGKNVVPMKDLAAVFADAGCRDVRTYIQSGNVVFRGPAPARLRGVLEARIERTFGLRVPVVLRTADELAAVTRSNPYLDDDPSTDALHVVFLADQPTDAAAASLDPKRSPPDTFTVMGREIYLRCPAGVGRSKLTNAYFDGKLSTVSTVRNWRTVLKLLELAGGGA
jgi:uncharacterized protein (DUF1697 family)